MVALDDLGFPYVCAIYPQGATKDTVEEMVVFSLDAVHSVICCAGSALVLAEPLARMVQVDLLYAMCQAVVRRE